MELKFQAFRFNLTFFYSKCLKYISILFSVSSFKFHSTVFRKSFPRAIFRSTFSKTVQSFEKYHK